MSYYTYKSKRRSVFKNTNNIMKKDIEFINKKIKRYEEFYDFIQSESLDISDKNIKQENKKLNEMYKSEILALCMEVDNTQDIAKRANVIHGKIKQYLK